jgi:hypothetical protein
VPEFVMREYASRKCAGKLVYLGVLACAAIRTNKKGGSAAFIQ